MLPRHLSAETVSLPIRSHEPLLGPQPCTADRPTGEHSEAGDETSGLEISLTDGAPEGIRDTNHPDVVGSRTAYYGLAELENRRGCCTLPRPSGGRHLLAQDLSALLCFVALALSEHHVRSLGAFTEFARKPG